MVKAVALLSVGIFVCSCYTSQTDRRPTWMLLTVKTCGKITDRTQFFFFLSNDKLSIYNSFSLHTLLTYSSITNKIIRADKEGDICSDTSCDFIIDVLDSFHEYVAVWIESLTLYNVNGMFKYVSNFTKCVKTDFVRSSDINILCNDPNLKPHPVDNQDRPKCVPKICPPRTYGISCEHNCTRCKNGQCKRDGECVVKMCTHISHTGIKCDETCLNGHWGLEFETINNVSKQLNTCQRLCFCRYGAHCHAMTGACPGGLCEDGYKIGCEEKCPPRMWSSDNVNCDNRCECEQDEDCYHDGICPNGQKKLCRSDSHYGPNCTKKCHCINREICNDTTGHCINGCDLQHYGMDCQYVCMAGRYHMKNEHETLCEGRCYCRHNRICNATNGYCSNGCEVDYWGEACERECKYGPTCVSGKPCHCLGGNHKCNNETGCIECSHRWTGQDCQTTCKDNFWGPPACKNSCLCAQPSDCRVADGECRGPCPLRRYGKKCEKDCEHDTTGNILCSQKRCNCFDEDRDCSLITLKCRGACDIRYTGGYGSKCEKKCPDGHYIDKTRKCSGTCHCLIKNLCNVTTGSCVGDGGCLVGWVEPTCLEGCVYGGQGCKKSCNCFKNSACHPITGTCPNGLCELRHYGTDCQRKCPDGKFIETGSCKGICHCANRGQCRASDGVCMDAVCSTGWEGDSCQTQCKYGLAADNCQQICHCKGGHLCDHVTGYCPEGCDTRYHGRGCTLRCPINHFLSSNGSCTEICRCLNPYKCNATTGVCLSGGCERGYKGSDCQNKCRRGDGKFGKNCEEICHCKDPYTCNIKTGMCPECSPRYTGYNCQRTCPGATYLIKGQCNGQCHCTNIGLCRLVTGECLDGDCTPGWKSERSDRLNNMCNIPCPSGTWGQGCIGKCRCRPRTPCNHTNGYCKIGCDTRWYYSPACNKTCDGLNSEKYLDQLGKCTLDCECKEQRYCRVEHGVCEKGGCKSGAQAGSRCLEPCTNKRYRSAADKNCTETCHCSGDLPCDDIGGFCQSGCHHRYRGPACNDTCPHGSFGVKCSGVCHCSNVTSCHVNDGECSSDGCEDGYEGQSCQKPCSRNRYGHGCSVRCQCLNNAKCNHTTGECPGRKCNNRYDGQNCDHEICPVHRYRLNGECDGECHCLKSSDCDAKTGSCGGSRCVAGRKGENCQYVCRLTFGNECKKKCHCFDNRQCDITTGHCPIGGCDIRHTGKGCQTECPAGRYDPKTGCNKRCRCDKNEDCHIIHGYCRGGLCQTSRGLRFFGVDCQSRCKVGRYVINGTCSGECRCAVPEQCSVLNGSCNGGQCKPGWLGDGCNRECEDGTFGPRCSKKCKCKFKKPCEKDYGKCEDGCADGWTGDNCQWREDDGSMIAQIGIYAGSISGLAIFAVIFGYCAIALKKRRRQQAILEIKEYFAIDGATSPSLVSDCPPPFEVQNAQTPGSSRYMSHVSINRIESLVASHPSSMTGQKIHHGDSVQSTRADNLSELHSEMSKETQRRVNIEAWSEIDIKNGLPTTLLGSMRRSRDLDKSISAEGRSGQPRKSLTVASSLGSSKSSIKSQTSLDNKASRKYQTSQLNDDEKSTTPRDHQHKTSHRRRRRRKVAKTSHEGKETKLSKTSHGSKETKIS